MQLSGFIGKFCRLFFYFPHFFRIFHRPQCLQLIHAALRHLLPHSIERVASLIQGHPGRTHRLRVCSEHAQPFTPRAQLPQTDARLPFFCIRAGIEIIVGLLNLIQLIPEIPELVFTDRSLQNQNLIHHTAPSIGNAGMMIAVSHIKRNAVLPLLLVFRLRIDHLYIQNYPLALVCIFDLSKNLRAVPVIPERLLHRQKQNVRDIPKRQRRIKSAQNCSIIAGNKIIRTVCFQQHIHRYTFLPRKRRPIKAFNLRKFF